MSGSQLKMPKSRLNVHILTFDCATRFVLAPITLLDCWRCLFVLKKSLFELYGSDACPWSFEIHNARIVKRSEKELSKILALNHFVSAAVIQPERLIEQKCPRNRKYLLDLY
jgi:hypothetical protein